MIKISRIIFYKSQNFIFKINYNNIIFYNNLFHKNYNNSIKL